MVRFVSLKPIYLNSPLDKMTAISQTIVLKAFSWIKNVYISIRISLRFVPKGQGSIGAWRRTGDKPFPESVLSLAQFTMGWVKSVNH